MKMCTNENVPHAIKTTILACVNGTFEVSKKNWGGGGALGARCRIKRGFNMLGYVILK